MHKRIQFNDRTIFAAAALVAFGIVLLWVDPLQIRENTAGQVAIENDLTPFFSPT